MNPTSDVLEKRVAALEGGRGGAGAWAPARRRPAFCVMNLCEAGRQHRLLHRPLRRHLEPLRQHAEAVRHRGRASWTRPTPRPSPAPPTRAPAATTPRPCPTRSCRSSRSREVAAIGRKLGVPLIMDNTAAPILCKPLAARRGGGDALHHQVHRRPWHQHRRHRGGWRQFRLGGAVRRPLPDAEQARPELPRRGLDPGGEAARARSPTSCACAPACCATSARRWRRSTPSCSIQGLETLPLRMERHCANALKVAAWLAEHPEVTEGDPPHRCRPGEAKRRADADLKGGYGSLMGFELAGRRRGRRALHRRAEDVLPRRQHRRCAQPGDPPRHHHAQPALGRGAGGVRRDAGLCPAVHRHRAYRRHHRRPRPGAGSGGRTEASAAPSTRRRLPRHAHAPQPAGRLDPPRWWPRTR